jgi:hypothetical protein
VTLDDTAPGANFGASLARSGDDLFVGAPCEGGSEYSPFGGYTQCPGGVHTFHKYAGTWVPEQHILPSSSESNAKFGTSLAMLNGTLFVGAPGESSVLLYTRVGDTWERVGALKGSETVGFGAGVVAAAGLVAVSSSGGIDVFRKVAGTWTLDVTWKSKSPDATESGPRFALDGNRLFVADVANPYPAADAGDADGGSAGLVSCPLQIFDWTPGALTLAQSLDYPSTGPVPFAVDGSRLAVAHYASGVGSPAMIDIMDQPGDGGAYALTTSVATNERPWPNYTGSLLGLAGNEVLWVGPPSKAQLFTGSGASWAATGAPIALNFASPSLVDGFVMTTDEFLMGSPGETNFGEFAGTVESYGVSDAGLVTSSETVEPVQLLTGAEVLGETPSEAPTSAGVGTVVAAGPGIAVVSGVDTGFYVVEKDAGAWQVGGALVPTSVTVDGVGTSYIRVGTPQVAVAAGTIALATETDVFLFQRGANGWAESAHLGTGSVGLVSNLAFDGKTLAAMGYDQADSHYKVCLVDATAASLTLTTLPVTGTQGTNYAVSLGGDTLLVAPMQSDLQNLSQTETYVFQRTSSGWARAPSLVADTVSGSVMDDIYGVVTDGVTAAVTVDHLLGDPGPTWKPTVTFFSLVNGAWQKTQTVEVKTPTAGNLLLDGDLLYTSDVPMMGEISTGNDVVVLQRQAGTWSILTTIATSLGTSFPQGFGTSIALSGHNLLVGSPQETVGGKLGWGALYEFDPTGPVSGPTP